MTDSQKMQAAVIDVQGMTCQGCARSLKQALQAAPGVTEIHVDLPRSEAHVTFDSQATTIARLMEAVEKTGFTAAGFTIGPAA